MRKLLDQARAFIVRFVRDNAWVPLVGRALGIAASLLLLAGIGAGWLDVALDLGPPRAEAAAALPRREAARPQPDPPLRSAEPVASAPGAATPGPGEPVAKSPPAGGKVVLNLATEAELQRLPGVGPAKAKAIVALRVKLGGKFKRFEDLLRVRGIKRRSLDRIRESALLDPPVPEEIPAPDGSAAAAPAPGTAAGKAPGDAP